MPENFIFCSKCGAQNAAIAQFLPELRARAFQQPCASSGDGSGASFIPVPRQLPMRPFRVLLTAVFGFAFLAHLIDHVILGAVAAPLFFVMVFAGSCSRGNMKRKRSQEPSPELVFAILSSVFIYVVLAFAGQWLYEAFLTSSSWQGTIGKRVSAA